MTQGELTDAVNSGKVTAEEPQTSGPSSDTPQITQPAAQPPTSTTQFEPVLFSLQSTQKYLSAAPTFIPQTFQEQIQFVYDGTMYFLYFYANNQWNALPILQANYGDGSDGDVTISADITLSRDMFYNSLTINSGATLYPNGFKICSKLPIVANGWICLDGGPGGDGTKGGAAVGTGAIGTGSAGGTRGVGISTGSIKQPGDGKDGVGGTNGGQGNPNTKNGIAGDNENNCILGNNAISGGNSGRGDIEGGLGFSDNSSTGGGGGTKIQTTKPSFATIVGSLVNALGPIGCNPTAGSGAGGGGGVRSGSSSAEAGGGGGGASGAPGGIGWFCAPGITVNPGGKITANGGNGGHGGDGGDASGSLIANYGGGGGGGGAPGNGGLLLLITQSYVNTGTVTVDGGQAGIGGTKGTGGYGSYLAQNGATTSAGHAGQIVQIDPRQLF